MQLTHSVNDDFVNDDDGRVMAMLIWYIYYIYDDIDDDADDDEGR